MLKLLFQKQNKDLHTVENVDITRYTGVWYEIARLPNRFEKGLECVTATYSLKKNGKIKVLNKGYSIKNKGKFKTAEGTARIPNPEYPGKIKVRFFWPFSGNYYIISLDQDYKYALVGDPSRKYLWILSRTRDMDGSVYHRLLDIARKIGFDVKNMIEINQDCN